MSKIYVNLKNGIKKFSYSELKNDIIISNIKIKNEENVSMDIQYKPNDIAKTYEFMLNDYFGIPVLNNITDDNYDDIPYQSYIQEVFESLSQLHDFNPQ